MERLPNLLFSGHQFPRTSRRTSGQLTLSDADYFKLLHLRMPSSFDTRRARQEPLAGRAVAALSAADRVASRVASSSGRGGGSRGGSGEW